MQPTQSRKAEVDRFNTYIESQQARAIKLQEELAELRLRDRPLAQAAPAAKCERELLSQMEMLQQQLVALRSNAMDAGPVPAPDLPPKIGTASSDVCAGLPPTGVQKVSALLGETDGRRKRSESPNGHRKPHQAS